MMAPHPPADGKLHPVAELAKCCDMTAGDLAGLLRAKGWTTNKQLSETEFNEAVETFQKRPMGGGRI